MKIRNITPEDAGACCDIYNYYILNTTSTLEFDPLSHSAFAERVDGISRRFPYIVAEEDGCILGYAYLHAFGERPGYRYTVSVSIYVRNDCLGHDVGKALMEKLLELGKEAGFKDVIAVVSSENEHSRGFHEHMGFDNIWLIPGVADKFGRRFGVYYMHKKLI